MSACVPPGDDQRGLSIRRETPRNEEKNQRKHRQQCETRRKRRTTMHNEEKLRETTRNDMKLRKTTRHLTLTPDVGSGGHDAAVAMTTWKREPRQGNGGHDAEGRWHGCERARRRPKKKLVGVCKYKPKGKPARRCAYSQARSFHRLIETTPIGVFLRVLKTLPPHTAIPEELTLKHYWIHLSFHLERFYFF